jgi:hypothetical protein
MSPDFTEGLRLLFPGTFAGVVFLAVVGAVVYLLGRLDGLRAGRKILDRHIQSQNEQLRRSVQRRVG